MSPTPLADPLASAPIPPVHSQWSSKAAGPPSPFPWSSTGQSDSIPSTPLHTPSLSPTSPFALSFTSTSSSGLLQTPPQQHSPTSYRYTPRFSEGALKQIEQLDTSKPAFPASASSSPSSRRDGLRTPSGFELLDWGEASDGGKSEPRNFDWEVYGPDSPHSIDLTNAPHQLYKRRLGPTEVSYYLGSRGEGVESGVNDMYLHIGFKARASLMDPERLLSIWTELITRHALLAATVEYRGASDVRFCYDAPRTYAEAKAKAKSLMETRAGQNQKELLDSYLNGPRTLSDERLSYLIISTPEITFPSALSDDDELEFDLHIFCTHFLGDGMALHTTANEFFTLLSAAPTSEGAISSNIESVFARTTQIGEGSSEGLPLELESLAQAMECKLVTPEGWGRMAWAGARVEFNRNQAKLVGGQAFTRAKLGERRTIVPTVSYDSTATKQALASCKSHSTTISHAIFALANIAYIRSTAAGQGKGERDERLPCMLYSALNVRPFLKGHGDSFAIAIGYYNIILPSFIPSSISVDETFWHRASVVRKQTSDVVKSNWMAPRTKLMALERERRAIGFEQEDERRREEKRAEDAGLSKALMGLGIGMGGEEPKQIPLGAVKSEAPEKKKIVTPSTALMGLSMLGNLDGMYTHKEYHGIKLHTLTTGSRQRPGALLLFAYTFAGKLWLSLGYDSHGFKEGVIEEWWSELQKGVHEFLLA